MTWARVLVISYRHVQGYCPSWSVWDWPMEGPYLAIHMLQPLEPQVGDNSRGAVIHWEDVYSELLRCCCHNLGGGGVDRGKSQKNSSFTDIWTVRSGTLKSVDTSEWALSWFPPLSTPGLRLRENTACWRALWGERETRGTGLGLHLLWKLTFTHLCM